MKIFAWSRSFFGRVSLTLCGVLLCAPGLAGQQAGQPADLILHNGKVLTVDADFSIAEAVAIRGNQFSAVGQNQDILNLAGPNTTTIDLKGRTVIPGLIDTHTHIHDYAERAYGRNLEPGALAKYPVDWRGLRNKEDVLKQIQFLMEKYQFKPGEWVYFENDLGFTGGGGSEVHAKIIMDELNRWELDKVAPHNPIGMSIGIPDFNGILLNSKAMEFLWENYGDYIQKYGRYWVDSSGRPEGHLEPPASRLLMEIFPQPSPELVAPLYEKYNQEWNAAGVTTVSTRLPKYSLEAYKLLGATGNLTIRFGYGAEWYFGNIMDLENGLKPLAQKIGTGDDKIWVTSVAPTAVDGSSTRACTNQKRQTAFGTIDGWWPSGQCHFDIEFRGAAGKAASFEANYFREWVLESSEAGLRYANTHTAGDRAVGQFLNMVEQIQRERGPAATDHWALDHCAFVDPADFERAARLRIMFSCAPKYIESLSPMAAESYGDQVANTFVVPLKSMLDAGVPVVFESDRDAYVWYDFELMLTRTGKDKKIWGPREKIDRVTALKMITLWAADYVLKGDQLGSIEPGKLADLVVLDRDYMTIPVEQVSDIRPQMTLLDGKIIFLHSEFAQEHNLKPAGAVISTYEQLLTRRASDIRTDF